MFTKLIVKNFKRLERAEILLAEAVVFIGPNNSGKTTALQALTLWDLGLHKWAEKRKDSTARERTGVTINRRDLFSIPIPSARLLWRDLHVRDIDRASEKPKTSNITFEITVEGISQGQPWSFGLEFDFANEESFYCRALNWPEAKEQRSHLLTLALGTRVAYLPPMSGLASEGFRKEPGEISVLIGQGRTAEVLRNLCHRVHTSEDAALWSELAD